MSEWLVIKNNSKVKLADIPVMDILLMRKSACELALRPLAFFGQKVNDGVRLFVALADDKKGEIHLASTLFEPSVKSYSSFTELIPAFHIFEREFYEEFGILPDGHPWLKPVRKNQDKYEFFKMEGEEVHEVAVGPIHAGVIEPGHFRFMCNGEDVYHLEIMLGYQHKGVEKLMVLHPSNQLAESICGDSVIAYNTAYSQVIETLSDTHIPERAKVIRILTLEMERAAIHIGDLGAIAGDIAYLMGASVFGATRTLVINTMLEFCGSRFGRGMVTAGGVNFDIGKELIEKARRTFAKVEKDVRRMVSTMVASTSVLSRLEHTGPVFIDKAKALGVVGMAAKSCGIEIDTRYNFPDSFYQENGFKPAEFKYKGDVYSRFMLRYNEILDSFRIIETAFKALDKTESPIKTKLSAKLDADSFAISMVEGWRGEVVHIGITDSAGKLSRYKIKDPSFTNWFALAMAVRNQGISDFPLCNKSFNLSYTGNDL